MKKAFKYLLLLFFIAFAYFFIGRAKEPEEIVWGVNFSQKHTENFNLSWKETYLAILEDLGARNIKIAVHWDLIEPEKDKYFFDDLDWQVGEAEAYLTKLILVIGMKTPRWPECHIPDWAKGLSKEEQQKEILELLEKIVLRYRRSSALNYWQVENEPFFAFGDCPWRDDYFFKKEVALVRSLDLDHSIIVSDSGEMSLWIKAAREGDVVGATMYRQAWFGELNTSFNYPIPPVFYSRKAKIIKKIFNKKVICIELQSEPWGPVLLYDLPLDSQMKIMSFERFKENIEYAKKTGLDEFYLWGVEWFYWLKEKHNDPRFWNEARRLFVR